MVTWYRSASDILRTSNNTTPPSTSGIKAEYFNIELVFSTTTPNDTVDNFITENLLMITEPDNSSEINKTKLKQFLQKKKVWEHFRIPEKGYRQMTPDDRFDMLKDYYKYMETHSNQLEASSVGEAAASYINKANVITLSKEGVGANFATTRVAKNDQKAISEISGEPIWNEYGTVISDVNLEKINFRENALLYINQAYLTMQKSERIYYAEYVLLGQIHESSILPSSIPPCVKKMKLNTVDQGMIEALVNF